MPRTIKKTSIEAQLKGDFRFFLTAVWTHLALPTPTRAQLCIAEYLQHGPKRLQIQAFRGVGKSWITAAFVLWTLYNDSNKRLWLYRPLRTEPTPFQSSVRDSS